MKYGISGGILGLAVILGSIAAWVTHIVWIVKALASEQGATVGQMVLGALGAFMPPVGVIHGLIIWFS
jgi:hypothetical protein